MQFRINSQLFKKRWKLSNLAHHFWNRELSTNEAIIINVNSDFFFFDRAISRDGGGSSNQFSDIFVDGRRLRLPRRHVHRGKPPRRLQYHCTWAIALIHAISGRVNGGYGWARRGNLSLLPRRHFGVLFYIRHGKQFSWLVLPFQISGIPDFSRVSKP